MAGDPADLAYGHALAMLGNPGAAAEVARLALRRAGRARNLVLGHARHEAVARAALDEPVDIDTLQTVVLDLPALAATLASTRPPEERAALDVRARTGGDLAALGESLGLRPSDAADKCAEIAELWERTLDPALLAFTGPGECDALAGLLADTTPDTVAKLLAVAPAVHTHSVDCTLCTDRVRAMVSVRSFFSDAAVEVPDSVRDASHRDRTKRPSAPPPPLFPTAAAHRPRWATPLRAVAAVAVIAALPVGFGLWNGNSAEPKGALTKVAAATGLRLEAQYGDGYTFDLRLHNDSERVVAFTLSTSADWLRVTPAAGRIEPGASVPLVAELSEDAPEGEPRAAVVAHTPSGATLSREFSWRNERPPELATVLEGCSVSLSVVDDGDLASLVLHWRDTAEHSVEIAKGVDEYDAVLRPDNGPVTYWVTASDNRGNAARTADQVINPGAC